MKSTNNFWEILKKIYGHFQQDGHQAHPQQLTKIYIYISSASSLLPDAFGKNLFNEFLIITKFIFHLPAICWRYWPCMHAQLLSHVQLFLPPWIVTCQAPLSMEFSRQEYWGGLPFPSPGGLLDPGIKPSLILHYLGRWFQHMILPV